MSESAKKIAPENEDLTYGDIVWGQFQKNRFAFIALYGLVFLVFIAIFCPIIASDRPFIWTENGETSYPWITSLFDRNYYENSVDIFFNLLLVLSLPTTLVSMIVVRTLRTKKLEKRTYRKVLNRINLGIFFGFILLFLGISTQKYEEPYKQYLEEYTQAQEDSETEISAVFAPIPYGYRKTGFKSLDKPSGGHWLGVDQSTRDVAVRMLYGTRIALSIGVIAVSIYITIGVIIGATAGFFGGWIDIFIVRFIEIFMSIPSLFVILALLAFIEKPSIFHIMAVIGCLRWTGVARLTRGEFLRLRNLDFVNSAIALGFPTQRIIFKHVLPNALGPVLVNATFGVASAILTESTLSFLGLGDISVPSWGQTLNEGYSTGAWHLILAPGFAIFLTVSLLNLVGEGFRDALDPKMRK
jgi:peptide/nickel transport system permease protein